MKTLDDELVDAAYVGDLDSVERLLASGANVHAADERCLRYATLFGYVSVVEVLLKSGADVHVYDDWTLRKACNNGYVSIVIKLVEAGADLGVLQEGWVRLLGCYAPSNLIGMSKSDVVELLLAEVIRKELA